jgi:hypothetical protein
MRGFTRSVCALVPLLGLAAAGCNGSVEGDDSGGDDNGGRPDAAAGGPDAAAGPDAAPAADARTDRFRCLGDPLPTDAADPIAVTGKVSSVGLSTTPVVGATVEVFRRSGGAAIATATSVSGGNYTLSVVTGGDPLDTYVRATSGSLLKTELYAGSPVVADTSGSDFLLTSAGNLRFVTNLVDVTQEASLGAVTVRVADCDNNPVAGATITGFGGTRVFYAGDDGRPSADPTETGSQGLAFVFNVPVGNLTINADVDGETLRANTIASRAGTIALAAIAP